MFVDGHAYPCPMAASAEKRAEEEAFVTGFERGLEGRYRAAHARMAERIRLEYSGIDCAETPAGELLLLEGSTCMAAHDMDRARVFPYKGPPMLKLFAAFEAMLRRRSGIRAACGPWRAAV